MANNSDSPHINMRALFTLAELQNTTVGLADFKTIAEIITRESGCSKELLLQKAISSNDQILTKFLVESGADVDKSVECCRYLFGISRNDYDYDNEAPPLHIAISYGNMCIVKYLLDAGANKYGTDMHDQTAIDVANACRDAEILYQAKDTHCSITNYVEIAEFVKAYEYVPTKGVQEA